MAPKEPARTIDLQLPDIEPMASLEWMTEPAEVATPEVGSLTIATYGKTDLFNDPKTGNRSQNAAICTFASDVPNFKWSAQVHADLRDTYDAGALLLYFDDDHWAKLCLEYSPDSKPMIVSVVTHPYSDDCNSITLTSNRAHLRISRVDHVYAMHYALDDGLWQFVRVFRLEPSKPARIGFCVQSPKGVGCSAAFSDIQFIPEKLNDFRNGQ